MEKLSLGKPKMFHAWILIGSPKVLLRENSCEQGIVLSYDKNNTCIIFFKDFKHLT